MSTLTDCGLGGVEVRASLINYLDNGVPLEEVIQFSNAANEGQVEPSDSCGDLIICMPDAGTLLSLDVNAPGFVPTYFSDIFVTHSEYYKQLPMFTQTVVSESASMLPGFDINNSSVMVHVFIKDSSDAGCSPAGWTISLTDPDGGTVDAGVGYLSGVSFLAASATYQPGLAILYNLDTSADEVQINATSTSTCTYGGALDQYTGTVRIHPGYLSVVSYPIQ